MKKIIKKICLLSLIFMLPMLVNAASYNGYELTGYDIDIVVNENNTLKITEEIEAYFSVKKHGIFRKIPLKNTVERLDGTTSRNRARITDIYVSDNYTLSTENGYKVIKIGDANRTLTGTKKYKISYLYNLGKDTGKDYDELYFNLIGDEWDTSISDITFTIKMPKEFDESKLGFSSGRVGSTDSSQVSYTINNNIITGRLNGSLYPKEALTVRLELPEGYFVGASSTSSPLIYIMFLVPIIGVILSILLWYKYGRDEEVVETVEFYPPAGFNSLEIGFLYKGKADNKDITSLLVYLANKGYIEIVNNTIDIHSEKLNVSPEKKESTNKKVLELQNKIEEERKINPNSEKIKYYENMIDIYNNIDTPIDYEQYGLKSAINKLNNNSYVIRKLKEYDGNNKNEELFLQGLFKRKTALDYFQIRHIIDEVKETGTSNYENAFDAIDTITKSTEKESVTASDLYNSFYKTMNKISNNINQKSNKNQIFEKNATLKKVFIFFFIIISLITIIAIPSFEYAGIEELIVTLVLCAFYSPFFAVGIFADIPIFFRIFWLGFTVFHSMAFFSSMPIAEALQNDSTYLFAFVLGILAIIGMGICLKYLPKRNAYGREMLGKIKGFKNFLETAEKDRLEAMVMQNPTYFYDILPFTYVLGVSDKWISKFENIAMKAPDWYDSPSGFNVRSFGSFMDSTMTSAQRAMSSSPSSSSSGGSSSGGSGGGSSGGGSGGGGGGSW